MLLVSCPDANREKVASVTVASATAKSATAIGRTGAARRMKTAAAERGLRRRALGS